VILEGVVTTRGADGGLNIAPMGPRVDESMAWLGLRPFATSRTFANLLARPEGVFHVTDDVLLLAQTAVGEVRPAPRLVPAERVRGDVLADACRAYEFVVRETDTTGERASFRAEVVRVHRLRDFFGFNRAKHAVVEAAILATRVHILPAQGIVAEFERLEVLVHKTGGPREAEAFALLRAHVAAHRAAVEGHPP
jgi:hypothetical protein